MGGENFGPFREMGDDILVQWEVAIYSRRNTSRWVLKQSVHSVAHTDPAVSVLADFKCRNGDEKKILVQCV